MSFRSKKDGSHYPVNRSLYNHPSESRTYSKHIHFANFSEAKQSVSFADERWKMSGSRADRVHLLQAMNQAANRAKAESENSRVSETDRKKASEAHTELRRWVNEHKGKE